VEGRIFSPIRHHLHRPPPRPLAATRRPGRAGTIAHRERGATGRQPAAAASFFILVYFILASSGASGRRRPSWTPRGPGWIGTGRRGQGSLFPRELSFPASSPSRDARGLAFSLVASGWRPLWPPAPSRVRVHRVLRPRR
jgi:hypothetical protein